MSLEDQLKESSKDLLLRIGAEVEAEARRIAPVKEHILERDIQVFDQDLDRLSIEVGNTARAPYAPHVHYGTGIYGKYKTPVRPKEAKALRTPWGWRKTVKGQKPNPYLDNALKNYRDNGGLDRALNDAGETINKRLADSIKEALKSFK
jgi:hypothetical protein